MNDRYLFKAKRIDNGEWIIGNLLTVAKINSFICTGKIKLDGALKGHIYPEMYAVDESTICQCTGLEDKEGTLIFENDIVVIKYDSGRQYGLSTVEYGSFNCSCCSGVFGWYFCGVDCYSDGDIREFERYTVVGNKFDDAELLEKLKNS